MSIDFDNMPSAAIGEIESWNYGRNWFARGIPTDGRKPRNFGPQLSREAAERIAEDYINNEVI